MTSRRSALQLGAAAMAAAPLAAFVTPAVADEGMFSVPPLPYAYVSHTSAVSMTQDGQS